MNALLDIPDLARPAHALPSLPCTADLIRLSNPDLTDEEAWTFAEQVHAQGSVELYRKLVNAPE